MDRILLADDSPHAQRMGERILRDEGYEVVSVTDGETAVLRLADVRPTVILADVFLPVRSGLDICRYVKSQPDHRHVRIILTAGMLESFDEEAALAAGADAIIKKPFEASMVLETVKPLIAAAREDFDRHSPEAEPTASASEDNPPPLETALVEAPPSEPDQAEAPPPPEPVEPSPVEMTVETVKAAPVQTPELAQPATKPLPVETPIQMSAPSEPRVVNASPSEPAAVEALRPRKPARPSPVEVTVETVKAAPVQTPELAQPASKPLPVETPIQSPAPSVRAPEPEPELLPSGTGVSEEELLRAAVTLALDAAFPALVEDITRKVLRNLRAAGGPAGQETEPPDVPIPVASLTTDLS